MRSLAQDTRSGVTRLKSRHVLCHCLSKRSLRLQTVAGLSGFDLARSHAKCVFLQTPGSLWREAFLRHTQIPCVACLCWNVLFVARSCVEFMSSETHYHTCPKVMSMCSMVSFPSLPSFLRLHFTFSFLHAQSTFTQLTFDILIYPSYFQSNIIFKKRNLTRTLCICTFYIHNFHSFLTLIVSHTGTVTFFIYTFHLHFSLTIFH